jgi:hypothetical protein
MSLSNITLDMEYIKEVCKIGKGSECCRYLTCGVNGFTCSKMNPFLKERIDYNVSNGKMIATSDNCDGIREGEEK